MAMQWSAAQPPPSMRHSWARSNPSFGLLRTCAMEGAWRAEAWSGHWAAAGTALNGDAAAAARSRRAALFAGLDDTAIAHADRGLGRRRAAAEEMPRLLEIDVDHRRDEQRQQLRHEEPADHGEAQGAAQLGAGAEADGDRQAAHDRRHGGHHDRPEAQQARLVGRLFGTGVAHAPALERRV